MPNDTDDAPPETAAAEGVAAVNERRGRWWWWGRWVALVIVVSPVLKFGSNAFEGFSLPVVIIGNALINLLFVVVVGGLVWLLTRIADDRASWTIGRCLLAPGTLITVAVLLAMGGLGQHFTDMEEAVTNPDPVGMKLAGKSDQISESDKDAFGSRLLASKGFLAATSPVIADYGNGKISNEAWVATTQGRLRAASRALTDEREKTARIDDPAVRQQWVKQDVARARVLAGLQRLLRAVLGTGSLTSAENATDRALNAARADWRRHWELLRPYASAEEENKLDKALAEDAY